MKPGGPWSVKGIEPEVRETAKSAARRAGKTLGEWLNQVIMETGQEPDPNDVLRNSAVWAEIQSTAPWSEVINDLSQRFEASEGRHTALLKNIDDAIIGLSQKLSPHALNEAAAEHLEKISGQTDEVAGRVNILETQARRSLSKDDLGTIERAMSNVALVLDASEKRHGEKIHAVDSSLGDINQRLDHAEERLSEALATLEAGRDTSGAQDAQTDILNSISDDMAQLDERLRETHDRSEQALENVHRNISTIVGRLDESDSLTNDALVGSIARTETSLTEVAGRVAVIESQGGSSTDELENRLAVVFQQLDQTRADQQTTLQEIKASLDGLAGRMASLENISEQREQKQDDPEQFGQEQVGQEPDTARAGPSGAVFDRSEFEEILLGKEAEGGASTEAPYEPVEGSEGWAEAVLKSTDEDLLDEAVADDAVTGETDVDDTGLEIGGLEIDGQETDPLELKESVDEDADAPKTFSITEKLQELRSGPLSQSPEDEEHFRGSLRELVTRDEDYKSRRPYFWVAGALIALTMVLIGVVLMTGRGQELAVSGDRPSLLESAKGYLSDLVSGDNDADLALESRDLPVVETEVSSELTNNLDSSIVGDDAGTVFDETDLDETTSDEYITNEELSDISVGTPTSSFLQLAEMDVTAGLMQAAESGDAKAQFALGQAFSIGTDFTIDEASATKWYRAAADQGLAVAQYSMGSRSERGIGTPRSGAQAVDWYTKAALGGNRKAMHNLAVAYATGEFVEQDLAGAARWFQEAAELGLADAQFNLGLLYERGIGVEASTVQAFKWFSVAALNGDATARQRADAIKAKLANDDLQFVELFIETWRPRSPDPIANGQFDFSPAAYTSGGQRVEVSHVQNMLVGLGFNLASVDGVGDLTTQKAIREYQELLGLPITGEISGELVRRLEASSN